MKKILFSALAVIMITLFNACEKSDSSDLNKENCKVTGINVSGGTTYASTFSYDTKGYISSSSTTANFGPVTVTYKFNYTRDNNGRTISLESVYSDDQGNGFVDPITVIYDDKGEKIIKLVENSDGAPYLVHNLKYNLSGLVTEYTDEYITPDESIYNAKRLFEYNAAGLLTKISTLDNLGKIYEYKVYEPKGDIMPTSEVYLLEHGLFPVDLVFNEVYSSVDGGVGSVQKVYSVENDNPTLIGTVAIKSTTLNARGFPESIVYGDTDGNTTIVNYQTDCSVNK